MRAAVTLFFAYMLGLGACAEPDKEPAPRSYRLHAGPQVLEIPRKCVNGLIGPPQDYVWTKDEHEHTKFYLWMTWPELACLDEDDYRTMRRTSSGGSTVMFQSIYYGDHAKKLMTWWYRIHLFGDYRIHCPPLYGDDGAWRPPVGACAEAYRPAPAGLKKIGETAGTSHFTVDDRNAPIDEPRPADLYVEGTLDAPKFLMLCIRSTGQPGYNYGAGRMCRGVFAHEGFVTDLRFSLNYVPVSGTPLIRQSYIDLLASMQVAEER